MQQLEPETADQVSISAKKNLISNKPIRYRYIHGHTPIKLTRELIKNTCCYTVLSNVESQIEILGTLINDTMCVKEIYRFRFDEDKIWVYKCNKSLPFDISVAPQCPLDAPCYSHESLPAKYWPIYINMCRFMTIIRKKTPKITIYIDDAKAVLYDSPGFFQVQFFVELTKVIFGNGIQIFKATGEMFNLAYINSDTIPENVKPLLYRASELYDLARDYERAEKSFPIVIGKKSFNQTQQKQMDRIVPDFTPFSMMIGQKSKIATINQIVPGFPTFS